MTSGETTPPAPPPPTATDDVREAHARWWNALLDEDVATLDALLADDLTFHGPGGSARTKAQYLENLRSGRLAYDSIAADEPLIRMHGAAAIVTGRADILFQSQGQPRTESLYYTAVYGWTAPQWRMLAWQSTIRADARG
jgi:ketosteroid isomerase-like protein